MEVLVFSNYSNLIKHIVDSQKFSKISIFAFGNQDFNLDKSLMKNIDVLDCCSSKDIFSNKLRNFNPESRCISFGCSYIFKENDLKHFNFPILNFHTGKIPENRGRTPLFWDIINNEKYSYGTVHAINSQIDMGIILDEVKTPINEFDTPITLANNLIQKTFENGYITKWLTSSKEDILKSKKNFSEGKYLEAFSISKNYKSLELSSQYLERLWRCYSIWGKVKINGNFYSDISIKQNCKNSTKLKTSDNKYLYGVKLE